MPYGVILLVAAVVLAVRFVARTRASGRSKCLVSGAVAASVVLGCCLPGGAVAGALFQLAICAYVLLYETVMADAG